MKCPLHLRFVYIGKFVGKDVSDIMMQLKAYLHVGPISH